MFDKDFQAISGTTGQFQRLTLPAVAGSGSSLPAVGKSVPAADVNKPDLKALADAVSRANRSVGRDLRFEVNLDSKRAVIQVLDSETGEVIREIPPEKAKFYMGDGGDLAMRLLDASA